MSVPNFSQFGELQFLGPNMPKKHFRMEYLDKCMVQVVSCVFGWFQVVPRFSKYDFFSVL